jgi:hypothetical protein
MSNNNLMNAAFRLRKAILYQGVLFTALFTIAVAGYSTLLFLDNPPANGFKNARAAQTMGFVGIAIFGLMALLSAYLVASYFVVRFSVDGTTIRIRSIFRNTQFDASALRALAWTTRSQCGKLIYRTATAKAVVDLYGYSNEDRILIIRIVRALVPDDVQTGWDEFCHFIALPLREGRRIHHPNAPVHTDPMSLPESARVLMTRKRCDRFFGIVLGACLAAAAIIWFKLAIGAAIVLPCVVILFWLLTRFSYPKEGAWRAKWAATPETRAVGIGQLSLPAIFLLMLSCKFAGFNPVVGQFLGMGFLLVFCVAVLRQAAKRQRAQRGRDWQEIPESVARWNANEDAVLSCQSARLS